MAEKMILELPVHADKRDELIAMMQPALSATVAFEGCQGVELWTPEDDPGKLLIFEIWAARENQAAYFKWRMETGLIDALGSFLTGAPKVIWLGEHAIG